jgi:hypothetical protein
VSEEEYIGIVGEIFDGYTDIKYNNQTVYLKHFSIRDQRYIHKFYIKYKNIAESKGIPSEKEMLDSLIEDGIWTEEDEIRISHLTQEIDGLKQSQKATILPSKKQSIQKSINSKSQELLFLTNKKYELIGKTSESYASQRSNEEFIRYLIYQDPECKTHLFSDEEFAAISEEELSYFVKCNNEIAQRLNEKNIQSVVLRDFFNMYMSQTENVSAFYGKPIIQLSVYQLKLAIYSRVFFNIFQYHEDVPERIKQDPEAILNFIELKKNNSKSQYSKDDSGASAVFGATKEDLEYLDPNAKKLSLSSEIEKRGGSMSMEDFIDLMS